MTNGIATVVNLQATELPIAPTTGIRNRSKNGPAGSDDNGPDFADAIAEALQDASESERVATDMAVGFADGDPEVGIHDVVIAYEKSNLSLRYTVTLKNKLLEAYRDLMSTQV